MRKSQKLTFVNAAGHKLAARLDLPEGPPRAVALFAHCFTCGKDSVAAHRIARALAEHDIATFRFDFSGIGDSAGEFENATFTANVTDLVRAAETLREELAAPTLLIGHSLGGAAVLAAAEQIPEVKAVVTIGAPADPKHVVGLFEEHVPNIDEHGEAEVVLAGRKFRIRREFLDDVAGQPQAERIAGLGRALLVMHAPHDEYVDVDEAREIYEMAKHPKSFVSLDDADHLLTDPGEATYAAGVIAAWADRYLPPTPAEADQVPTEPSTAIVSDAGGGKFTQRVQVGRHIVIADEPANAGGDDLGPTPYGLLLAALGACTSMSMRMYAERKNWPLRSTTVTLSHSRIHAKDCEDCDTEKGMLDHINREIEIDGDLDVDQRGRLLEIADKCPVHRTLHSEVVVHTSEVSP